VHGQIDDLVARESVHRVERQTHAAHFGRHAFPVVDADPGDTGVSRRPALCRVVLVSAAGGRELHRSSFRPAVNPLAVFIGGGFYRGMNWGRVGGGLYTSAQRRSDSGAVSRSASAAGSLPGGDLLSQLDGYRMNGRTAVRID